MPIVQTANGPVMVDDNAPPEVIARIRAQNSKPRASAPATRMAMPTPTLSPDQQEVQRRLNIENKVDTGFGSGLQRKFLQGITSNHMDELLGGVDAATRGVYNAFKKGDIHEIGKEYRISRDVERAKDQQDSQGTGSTIAEIAGALANPIGTGAKALQALKFAPKLVRAGQALEKAPALIQGITAGALQGGLNAEGSAREFDPYAIGQGAVTGAAFGGALGGAAVGARRGVQILRDRAPAAAERIAHMRIGRMLEDAGTTPERAERELAVTKARGGDPVLMEMTPGLRAEGAALSRRPDIPTSNAMIDRGQERLLDRPAMYEQKLREYIQPSTGVDADAHLASVTGARKAHGVNDYEQALDGKFHWNNDLQEFMAKAPPEMHAAMRDGAHLASLYDQDVGKLGMKVQPDGAIVMDTTPSMRVFDYAKRAMDAKISAAYKAGDNALAGGLSNQLSKFKQKIIDANPQYADVLAKQQDYFQRAKALELGTDVVSRMKAEPKKVLAELRALDPTKHDDARTGIADALIALRSQKADPVTWFKGLARTPEQRKVLEFAFNGKGNLNRFERWMDRELRAKRADEMIAPGRQSITSTVEGANKSLGGDVGDIAEHGLRGFAFGGPAGASAGITRKLMDLKNGMSPSALDAMAKALMGDGTGVAGKVSQARTYAKIRKIKNARAAVLAAKAGQQPITDYAGD